MYCSNNAASEIKKDESFWDWSDPIEESPIKNKVKFAVNPMQTLKSLTLEVLEKNIDRIDNIHNFPRDLMLSFLKKASASSLFFFEKRNPRVKEDTDGLWERHYKGDFPRSNIHRKEQKLHSWRYCYLLAKREEKEKSIRFAKKFRETQEASKAKRQIQVECMPSNHPLRFSHSERLRYEGLQRYYFINRKLVVDIARALKANPDFEKIRRQTIQQSRRSINVGRPCPTPAGMPMSMTYPVMPRPASSSSSSSMSPPSSFPSNSSSNAWSMAPPQLSRPAPITSRVRDESLSSSGNVDSRKSGVFPSRPPNAKVAKKPNNAHKD